MAPQNESHLPASEVAPNGAQVDTQSDVEDTTPNAAAPTADSMHVVLGGKQYALPRSAAALQAWLAEHPAPDEKPSGASNAHQLAFLATVRPYRGHPKLADIVWAHGCQFDLDGDAGKDIGPTLTRLNAACLGGLIWESHRSTAESPKARLIVLWDRPLDPERHRAAYEALRAQICPLAPKGQQNQNRGWNRPRASATVHLFAGRPATPDLNAELPKPKRGRGGAGASLESDGADWSAPLATDVVQGFARVAECRAAIDGQGGQSALMSAIGVARVWGLPLTWHDDGTASGPAVEAVRAWDNARNAADPWFADPEIWRKFSQSRMAHGTAAKRPFDWVSLMAEIETVSAGQEIETKPRICLRDPCYEITLKDRVDQIEQVLAGHVFQVGGKLVKVQDTSVRAGGRDPESGEIRRITVRGLHELKPATIAHEISALAEFWVGKKLKTGGLEYRKVDPPLKPEIETFHGLGHWEHVPPIAGIATAPVLRPDGSLLQAAGYDRETGWFYEPPPGGFPAVAEAPSRDDARAALAALLEPFADFPWRKAEADGEARGEVDRYLPIALILSALARPVLSDVPAFGSDASTPGSGKTLAWEVASIVAWGRVLPKLTFPADPAELEKILASCQLACAPVVAFDNVSPDIPFGGAPLDKAITAGGSVQFRVLGQTNAPERPWTGIVLATGNNLCILADMARRILVCRQEPDVEKPEERTGFKIPDLLAWTRRERPRLVWAALTLLRAYWAAERPRVAVARIGGFESWCDLVPSAIVWAGGADVCQLKSNGSRDATSEGLPALYQAIADATDGKPKTAKELLAAISAEALESIISPGKDGKISPVALGQVLNRSKDRVFDGLKLTRVGQKSPAAWLVQKTGTSNGVLARE